MNRRDIKGRSIAKSQVEVRMGKRREQRKQLVLPVRIFGTDNQGRAFLEDVHTIDISNGGVRLGGVKTQLRAGETIGISYGDKRGHFKVLWTGEGEKLGAQVGLQNLKPTKPLWDLSLPAASLDQFNFASLDRRRSPRVKCLIPVEVHKGCGHGILRGNVSDLSVGGCFVEAPIQPPLGTELTISLWLGTDKLQLDASIVSRSQGFGFGIRFENLTPYKRLALVEQVKSLSLLKLPVKAAAVRKC